MICFTIVFDYLLLRGIDCQRREIHGVSTHIRNFSALIQRLRNTHRLGYRETQLTSCFLLKRGGCKRRSGTLFARLFLNAFQAERSRLDLLKERYSLLLRKKTMIEFRMQNGSIALRVGANEISRDAVLIGTYKLLNLLFALHRQPYGY